jgi:multiple sugar transport system substrate-binding protein
MAWTLTACTETSLFLNEVTPDRSFRIWWNEGYFPEETAAVRRFVEQWAKTSKNEVKLTFFSEKDLAREITNAIARNNPPDILYSYSADLNLIPRLAWEGKLADVSDVVSPVAQQFTKTALSGVTYTDNTSKKKAYFAVPISQSGIYLHYWRNLLQQTGVNERTIPQDWEGFWGWWRQVHRALSQRKGAAQSDNLYTIGLPVSPSASDTFYAFELFLEAYNVEILDSQGQLRISDPQVRNGILRAVTEYTKFYREKLVPPSATEWGDPDNNERFLNSEMVMTANPTLSIPGSQRSDEQRYFDQMVTIPWPRKPDGSPLRNLVATKQACLFANSPNQKIAKDFFRYLLQPENLDVFVKGSRGRFAPVMPKLLGDPFWRNPRDTHISNSVKTLENTRPLYQVLNPAYTEVQARNVWGSVLQQVALGKLTPEAATDRAIAEIQVIFENWQS